MSKDFFTKLKKLDFGNYKLTTFEDVGGLLRVGFEKTARAYLLKPSNSDYANLIVDAMGREVLNNVSKMFLTGTKTNPTEDEKQKKFNKSIPATVGILLDEFANGGGSNKRDFYYGEDKIVEFLASGRVKNIIVNGFYRKITNKTYEEFVEEGEIMVDIPFSPGDKFGVFDSAIAHLGSNLAQLFVGGAIAHIRPTNRKDKVNVEIHNNTSRRSFFYHQGESYQRDASRSANRPLSTISQSYHFGLIINPDKFKK